MKFLPAFALSILVAACGASYNGEQTKTEAGAALQDYVDAINAGDVALAASFYDKDPDFHWVERGGIQYDDAADAAASLEGLVVPGSTATMTLDQVRVADVSADAALVSAHFDYAMSFEGGTDGFAFDGWMTVAMVRRADGWRIAGGQVGPGAAADGPG